MDKELRGLFEFQKFESNPHLDKLVKDCDSRNGIEELSLDDLSMVNAAGLFNLGKDKSETISRTDKESEKKKSSATGPLIFKA